MRKISFLILFTAILLQSCSPKIRTNLSNEIHKPLDSELEILVVDRSEDLPKNSRYIGELRIGDSGFSTNCGYNKVISEAKKTARASGANLIHLIQVRSPSFESTCYRLNAKLYRNLNSDALAKIANERKLKDKSRLPPNADYAVVYFYRPKNFGGSLVGYKVRMDDETVIGRVRNGEKFEYKVTKFGKHEFWAKTESKTSVIINVEKGQEYFVRCGIGIGVAIGKPEMNKVNNKLGISEYESMKDKKRNNR